MPLYAPVPSYEALKKVLEERLAEGHDIADEERALMARALEENSVIVAQMTPFYDDASREEAIGEAP